MLLRSMLATSALLLAGCATHTPAPTVAVRILAFNDFHGNLEASTALGAAIVELARDQPQVMVVGAGNMVGASPPISAARRDEPAVRVLDALGLEVTAVGEREFERGRAELLRLQKGGCHPVDGCTDGPYEAAQFQWVAANVFDASTGKSLLPAYVLGEFDGIQVAFIGVGPRGTPGRVDAAGIAGLEFRDEAESVNALIPGLKRQGVEAIVVLAHPGEAPTVGAEDSACPGFAGSIVDIVRRLDRAVDVVVSGHARQAYACRIDGRLVTSGHSHGRMLTAIDLTLERATGDVRFASARNHAVSPERFGMDAAMEGLVARYRALAGEIRQAQ